MPRPARGSPRARPTVDVELALAPGLEDVARRELEELASRLRVAPGAVAVGTGALRLAWPAPLEALHALRTVDTVARAWSFPVQRPRALLGDEALRGLRAGVEELVRGSERPFSGLRMSAAGRDSSVLQRLADELADAADVPVDGERGDLVVRVRRGPHGGWEVLVRTTPRPLSVRDWRVCDRPGGLDATVAAAAVRLAGVRAGARVLAAMAGSGTLLVERGLAGPAAALDAFDVDHEAVACARANVGAAGLRARAWRADVRATGLEAGSYDLVLVDPPWGDAVGSHATNAELYAAMLDELARVAARGARLVLVTHEVRLTRRLLAEHPSWRTAHERRVWHGGHRPSLAVLERRGP